MILSYSKLSPRSVIQILSPSCHLITFDAHAKNFLRISRMDVSEKSRFSLPSRCVSHALNLPRYLSRFCTLVNRNRFSNLFRSQAHTPRQGLQKWYGKNLAIKKWTGKYSFRSTVGFLRYKSGYFIAPLFRSSSRRFLPSSESIAKKSSFAVAFFSASEIRFFLFSLAIPLATK